MLLEEISGVSVNGYRAPSYSITSQSLWAMDILVEEGFTYDSSIFPVMHDTYGIPEAPRFPHIYKTKSGSIQEFPLTTWPLRLPGKEMRLPVAGGGYLRLLPPSIIIRAFNFINCVERKPAVLYLHPWEIDPDQPRIKAGFRSRFRHYLNLEKTEEKLHKILSELQFNTMSCILKI
jgi:polysaccharide deacetylase family protein (PEP-CTERM system associated)